MKSCLDPAAARKGPRTMHFEDMAEAIGRAHGAALDAVTRALWAAVAAGQVDDDDAAAIGGDRGAQDAMGRPLRRSLAGASSLWRHIPSAKAPAAP